MTAGCTHIFGITLVFSWSWQASPMSTITVTASEVYSVALVKGANFFFLLYEFVNSSRMSFPEVDIIDNCLRFASM